MNADSLAQIAAALERLAQALDELAKLGAPSARTMVWGKCVACSVVGGHTQDCPLRFLTAPL